MVERPCIESTISHGGDPSRIAAWILDCLDRDPPPGSGDLTLYLCYNSGDINCFGSGNRNQVLARAVHAAYLQEQQWDDSGTGRLRFDLGIARAPSHLALSLREEFLEFARGPAGQGQLGAQETAIEFCWQQADMQIGPGTIGLVRRWREPLRPGADLCAVLTAEKGASITRHLDRWQRESRWHQPEIYFPAGRSQLFIGPWVGCDLLVPELRHPLQLSFESESDEWRWVAPGAPQPIAGRQRGDLRLELPLAEGQTALTLSGRSLQPRRSLESQERSNRLPLYSLDILGLVVPFAPPAGYGVVPQGLPALVVEWASSALRLPGGTVLYRERNQPQSVYIYNARDVERRTEVRARRLNRGMDVGLKMMTAAGGEVRGEWQEPAGLPPGFGGELILKPALDCRLACGIISEDVPEDFFPDYNDITLGRAPLRLESRDGRRHTLVYKQSARHPVYVRTGDHPDFRPYSPDTARAIPLTPRIDKSVVAEFILGSTHYRLREIAEANDEYRPFELSFIPVGGAR